MLADESLYREMEGQVADKYCRSPPSHLTFMIIQVQNEINLFLYS
jgi:hypothetical protein